MIHPLFWFGTALGVAVSGLALALLSRRWRAPNAGNSDSDPSEAALPRTQLQSRAYWGLIIGAIATVAATVVVVQAGPSNFQEDDGMRLTVYGIFGAASAAYGIACLLTRRAHAGEVQLDERDREILARAPRAQAAAILFTLLVWTIALTELYWESGSIPIAFPFLIFLTSCIVGLLAFSAGIVIGYRRA